MNLSFNNLSELDEFLQWASRYRAEDVLSTPLPTIDLDALARHESRVHADGTTVTGPGMPPPVTGDPSGAVLQPVTEPTKRKRRTKAEIEADEKAAADAAGAEAHHVDIARVVHADGSVTTTSVGLPPDVNPSDVTGVPTGANPFEQAATAPAGESTAAETGSESDVVTPFQHLTRAREFIAKHGMPKYNESFAKAGLDANVMGYTAYQRGVHMDVLTALESA